jgi:hypothetical protein
MTAKIGGPCESGLALAHSFLDRNTSTFSPLVQLDTKRPYPGEPESMVTSLCFSNFLDSQCPRIDMVKSLVQRPVYGSVC